MNTVKSCDVIRQSLVTSNLHYFINESPHSIWITVRKKFMNTELGDKAAGCFESPALIVKDTEKISRDFNLLMDKYNSLVNAFETMKVNYEHEINEHEATIKEKNKAIVEN